MKKIIPLFTIIACVCCLQSLHAQSIGDYRTKSPGKWSNKAIWQMYNGLTWGPALIAPNALAGIINVRDSVEIADTVYADQIIVDSNKVLYVKGLLVLMNGAGTDMLCRGRLAVGQSASVRNDTLVGGSTIEYKAPFLNTAGGISPDITFSATVTQSINGPGYFGLITVNNSKNVLVTGNQAFSGVHFVAGRIIVTGNFLITQYTLGFTGQSNSRFIDGDVVCIIYDKSTITFSLPIGKNGHYSPIVLKLQQDSLVQTEVVVSPRDSAPPVHALPGSLDKVSTIRYINISKLASAGKIKSASLQMSYDATDGVTDPASLRVARSSGGTWQNMGGTGTAPTQGNITITTELPAKGDYVLANAAGGSNTLPLRFTSFTASPVKQAVQLNWATAQEVNTSYFNIQRKDENSTAWQTIGKVNTNQQTAANTYGYVDFAVSNNSTYWYRLNEVDKDGSLFTSKTVQVRIGATGKMDVSLMYPNPAKDVLHYKVSAANSDALSITVINNNGTTLQAQKVTANQVLQVNLQKMPAGTYYLTVINEKTGEKVVRKFVKE